MSDSALSVRFRRFRYQAQSDIADHRYCTKWPPLPQGYEPEHLGWIFMSYPTAAFLQTPRSYSLLFFICSLVFPQLFPLFRLFF